MSNNSRHPEEYKNAIKDQLTFIKNSCFLFDTGCKSEGLRIAGALSILLEERATGKKKRKTGKGLLRSIPDTNFKILSVVPDVVEVDLNKLILSRLENQSELDDEINRHREQVRSNNRILLIYVVENATSHLFAIDGNGEEVSCSIAEIKTLKKRCKPIIGSNIISSINHNDGTIPDVQKRIIIDSLS